MGWGGGWRKGGEERRGEEKEKDKEKESRDEKEGGEGKMQGKREEERKTHTRVSQPESGGQAKHYQECVCPDCQPGACFVVI